MWTVTDAWVRVIAARPPADLGSMIGIVTSGPVPTVHSVDSHADPGAGCLARNHVQTPGPHADIMARYQILPFSAALNCSICLAGRWEVAGGF